MKIACHSNRSLNLMFCIIWIHHSEWTNLLDDYYRRCNKSATMLQPKFLATKEMNRVCCPPFLCLIKTQCPQMNQLLYMRSLYPKNSTWKPKLKEPAVDDAGSKVCFNNPMRSENFFLLLFTCTFKTNLWELLFSQRASSEDPTQLFKCSWLSGRRISIRPNGTHPFTSGIAAGSKIESRYYSF